MAAQNTQIDDLAASLLAHRMERKSRVSLGSAAERGIRSGDACIFVRLTEFQPTLNQPGELNAAIWRSRMSVSSPSNASAPGR